MSSKHTLKDALKEFHFERRGMTLSDNSFIDFAVLECAVPRPTNTTTLIAWYRMRADDLQREMSERMQKGTADEADDDDDLLDAIADEVDEFEQRAVGSTEAKVP